VDRARFWKVLYWKLSELSIMPKTIITTVGTSLITNWLKGEVAEGIPESCASLKNKPFYQDKEVSPRILLKYAKSASKIKKLLAEYLKKEGEEASAETASCKAIQKEFKGEEIIVCLICTDTILSPLCAEVIRDWMENDGIQVLFETTTDIVDKIKLKEFQSKYIIRDLQIDNKNKFEKRGLINLIETFKKVIDQYYKDFCLLNITGGYKGMIPFLTVFSQISKVKIFYLFEETQHIINIPQLNIDIDWGFYLDNRHAFSLLKEGSFLDKEENWEAYKKQNNLPDEFDNYYQIYEDGEDKLLELNAIGYLLVQEYDNHIFVNIPVNLRYFKDDVKAKKEAKRAIKVLYNQLNALQGNFDTYTDKLLKHCMVKDTIVFKETNVHLRIQYKFNQKEKELTVFNYYYKSEKGNDYANCFENEYDNYKDINRIHLAIEK